MKLTIYATAALALLWPAVSSAQDPSGEGFIIFDNKCNVQATDFTINATVNPSQRTVPVVFHLVDGGCRGNPKVAVGTFGRKGWFGTRSFRDLLTDCEVRNLTEHKPIHCNLNLACTEKDVTYTYGVCVDGKEVFDPELRIKGGTRGPSCPDRPKAVVKKKCVDDSRP